MNNRDTGTHSDGVAKKDVVDVLIGSLSLALHLRGLQFAVAAPDRAGLSDIPALPPARAGCLAGIEDLFDGERVGYTMSERMTRRLVSQALFRAVVAKRPAKNRSAIRIAAAGAVRPLMHGNCNGSACWLP